MARVKGISKSYGPELVLRQLTFNLGKGQKVALIGPNGVGKTTLLRVLAGLESADEGTIDYGELQRIGYLPQQVSVESDLTVENYIKDVIGLNDVEREIYRLSATNDPSVADRMSELQEQYEFLGGYDLPHRIRKIFAGIGLKEVDSDRLMHELSGGQKTRVAIAAILLRGQDLLLLDEPTNNLDLEAIEWLEDFVRSTEAACIIVSHDTRFLDEIAEKVFEIDPFTKQLSESTGNYSDYVQRREKAENRLREAFRIQQEDITRLEGTMAKQKAWAAKGARQSSSDNDKLLRGARRDRATKSASRAKTIGKRLSKMQRLELPKKQRDVVLDLTGDFEKNQLVVSLSEVSIGYSSAPVLTDVNVAVRSGQKIVIIGANGSGKTTLLKTLVGILPVKEGVRRVNPDISFGYFPQEHDELPGDQSVREFFVSLSERFSSEKEWRQTLHMLRFDEASFTKKIAELSPGMRAKLLLAAFALLGHDTLVLDEPTNHLDVDTVAELKAVLAAFSGTVITSTHDRSLIEALCPDFIWEIDGDTVTTFPYTELED